MPERSADWLKQAEKDLENVHEAVRGAREIMRFGKNILALFMPKVFFCQNLR